MSFFLCKDETAKALKKWLKIQLYWELCLQMEIHIYCH